jgi:hypothetical protein
MQRLNIFIPISIIGMKAIKKFCTVLKTERERLKLRQGLFKAPSRRNNGKGKRDPDKRQVFCTCRGADIKRVDTQKEKCPL